MTDLSRLRAAARELIDKASSPESPACLSDDVERALPDPITLTSVYKAVRFSDTRINIVNRLNTRRS